MTKVVEHLFMCFFDFYVSCLMKCLYKSFAHLKIVLFVLLLNMERCLYILEVSPLSGMSFTNTFSQPVAYVIFKNLR